MFPVWAKDPCEGQQLKRPVISMKLPNLDKAIIPEAKITEYLLSTTHPYGRHKARFFLGFGFRADSCRVLASALRTHAEEHEVLVAQDTPFGTRYNIEGRMKTPDGRNPFVRVIWFVDAGDDHPRLVTAYPVGESDNDPRT